MYFHGCPTQGVLETKQKKFGQNRNKICFGCVSACFVLPKTKNFGLFRCFEPISKQPKQTELFRNNRNNPKFSEKNTKIYSLKNCFGWSSVCFFSFETSKFSVSVQKRNNRNKHFVSDSAAAETNFGSSFGSFESKLVLMDNLVQPYHCQFGIIRIV